MNHDMNLSECELTKASPVTKMQTKQNRLQAAVATASKIHFPSVIKREPIMQFVQSGETETQRKSIITVDSQQQTCSCQLWLPGSSTA